MKLILGVLCTLLLSACSNVSSNAVARTVEKCAYNGGLRSIKSEITGALGSDGSPSFEATCKNGIVITGEAE